MCHMCVSLYIMELTQSCVPKYSSTGTGLHEEDIMECMLCKIWINLLKQRSRKSLASAEIWSGIGGGPLDEAM